MAWIVPVSVASSVVGTCLAVCFTGGRISHVAAKEGHFSLVLAMIHVKRFTPTPSVILNVSLLTAWSFLTGSKGRLSISTLDPTQTVSRL